MSRHSLDRMGELQRAAMEVVWEMGEASVHDVRQHLEGKRPLAYTTVLTVMQKLEKAGWLGHRQEGNRYVYVPTGNRDEAGAGSVRQFLTRAFDGDAKALFQHLIRQSDLSENDLSELKKMIDDKRKEMRK
jgi:BlaI family transcriptional regulator, penicillinase repressor